MMNPALIALATRIGAPLVENALTNALGSRGGRLANQILVSIAAYAGVDVGGLERLATSNSQEERAVVERAVMMSESDMPQLIALYTSELEGKMTLLEAEQKGPLWTWAWRPAGMWGLGFLWFYNVAFLHWINAYFKTAIPQMDLWLLFQLTALYLSLYMGGHTIKDMVAKLSRGRVNG